MKEIQNAGKKDEAYRLAWKEADEEAARREKRMVRKARNKELEIRDGLLYRKNLLWVPGKELVNTILESEHDTKIAGHMGQDKTIELIRRNFWWPKMNERIIDFVQSCPKCQQNKAARHQPYGLSSPLELPYAPWQSIAMDFITELPTSEGCDQVWVVIDRFTKMAHFLPLKEKTASDLVKIFARKIWRHHGVPTDIVSGRDSRFTSETWKEFLSLLVTRPRKAQGQKFPYRGRFTPKMPVFTQPKTTLYLEKNCAFHRRLGIVRIIIYKNLDNFYFILVAHEIVLCTS